MPAKTPATKAKEPGLRLHRRQLFHWIGSDLERDRKLNAEQRAQKYVQYLRGSLQQGLWLRLPRKPENFGPRDEFRLQSPICCFTETMLDEIEFHNREYGRLGLGFPKRFVLSQGGRPVNYVNGVGADPSFQAWDKLRRKLSDSRVAAVMSPKEWEELQAEFVYLSAFLKMMKPTPKRRTTTKKVGAEASTDETQVKGKRPIPIKRHYGQILEYIEEREWRIVLKQQSRQTFPRSVISNPSREPDASPPFLLPYRAAHDLFTVVLPDARTKHAALQDNVVRSLLIPADGPPVTILALDDLSTF